MEYFSNDSNLWGIKKLIIKTRISLWLQLQISQRRNVSNRGRIRKKSGLKKIRRRIQVFTRYPNRGTFSITTTMHSLFWIFERMQIRGGHAWQFGWWSSTFSRWKFERGRARWRMIVVLERGWANLRGDMTATVVSTRGSNRRGPTRGNKNAILGDAYATEAKFRDTTPRVSLFSPAEF